MDHACQPLRVVVAEHARHQHQQVGVQLHGSAGKGVLRLQHHVAVDVFRDLGDAPADEMDAVVALRGDVEIFVLLSEEPQVHVEAPHFRRRELLLHLDGLLDRRHAAHL